MAIDKLIELIDSDPTGTPVDWAPVEARLGTKLPADYKAFVDRYGTGAIGDFLWVLTPTTANRFLNLFDSGNAMLAGYRELRANWPGDFPFAAYPEENGLLPWAVTDNGDELFWLTEGEDPDQWPTIISTRGMPLEEHRLPAGDLLAGLIAGRIRSNIIERIDGTFTPAD